ncbi:MAG TPA: efflux RND transporter periplasmic adaptor subunit [Blastocatellia bacterium]|nr:efflux RND transporter periplasmic adaptor subunit [Blastocatellia bacterium]
MIKKYPISLSNRRGFAALAALAIAALISAACKSSTPVSAKQGPGGDVGPRQVKVTQVSEMPMERGITALGALAAFDEATISVKVPGRVRSITVDLGSNVRKGQLIAQLDPADYQLRVEQAEAALAQARARVGLSPEGSNSRVDLEKTGTVRAAQAVLDEARLKRARSEQLVRQGVLSRAELDSVEAEYKVAESRFQDAVEEVRNRQAVVLQRYSEVEIARKQLSDTNVYAAFDGVVQEKLVNFGEYLAGGAPVVKIVRMNPLKLRVEVPERDSRSVRIGQQMRVTVEGDPNVYSGRIARISPTLGTESRTLIVEGEVVNTGLLKPGSFVRANIVTDSSSLTVAVPKSSVVTFAGIDKVISIQDGKAVEKQVTLGRRTDDWIEILSGVSVGETIVLDPGNLQSGQPVEVAQ